MITLSPTIDKTYTIADPATKWTLTIAGLTTQTPSCGYDQDFAVAVSPAFKSPAYFIMSATSPNINFNLYSRDIADAGDHLITLTSTLKNYNVVPTATAPSASKTFKLKAVNPCLSTVITADPPQIENLVSFAGYNTTSLQKYTFNDTISISQTFTTDSADFCGDK